MQTDNLGRFILEFTKNFSERPAFILKESTGHRRPLSFFEFNNLVSKISQNLKSKFQKPGFKVGLWGENRVEWCALAVATWHSGGILVPLMHIATEAEVKTIIAAARLDMLFISPKLGKKDIAGVNHVYSMDFVQTRGQGSVPSLGDFINSSPGNAPFLGEAGGEDLAILIFTSGTTGNPKGVMLTHNNIITNINDTKDVIPTTIDDRAISVLPLSHLFELVGGFTICHIKGICISYPDSLKPEDILGEMKSQKTTILVAVPLFFEIIDRAIQEKIRKLSPMAQKMVSVFSKVVGRLPFLGKLLFKNIHQVFGGHIRLFVTGGAKIDPAIIERFRGYGIYFLQGYGLTETSPIITFTSIGTEKFASVGVKIASIQLKLVDGEICVKGPTVFKGYFENPTATSEVLKDGWFHTGDVGEIDDEGSLYITGRKKDIIVTPNGKNIYPEELEETFRASPLIAEVAVVGLNSGRGEEVYAVVVPSPAVKGDLASKKAQLTAEIEHLSVNLSEYKRVKGIIVTERDLPKTATKKVRKHVLKQMIAQGNLEGAADSSNEVRTPLNPQFEREKWLEQKLQEISKKSEIWKEASLKQDLGLDSLTFVELVGAIESQWGVTLPDEDFDKIKTVEDVVLRVGQGQTVPVKIAAKTPFNYRDNNQFLMRTVRILTHALIIRPLLKIFFRYRVVNAMPSDGRSNWVATPNHASHLDLVSILSSVPLNKINSTYAVAADDYFFNTTFKSYFVRILFNAIPFERKARIDKGFKVCEEILKDGGNLIIFPEGTRSMTGQMADFKPGVGRLLASQKYPAVPVYIKGAYNAFPKGAALPRFKPVSVHIGKPLHFSDFGTDNQSYQKVASKLQEAVTGLKASSQM